MSEPKEFLLPDLGEGLTEAELVRWHVSVGDAIGLNQVIAEVETEKAVVELPSPFEGTVVELRAEPGTVVAVGSPLIVVSVEAEARTPVLVGYGVSSTHRSRRRRPGGETPPPVPVVTRIDPASPVAPTPAPGRPLAKPPVRYLARQLGVDLASVTGTGPDGTISRDDVLERAPAGDDVDAGTTINITGALSEVGRETRVPIRGVRQHTAEAMVRSAFTAPHVTEFVTVDVTPTVELIERLRALPVFEGARLTPLTVVAKALLLALRDNPGLNASWDEENREIVTKHYVNLGIAAATPRGLVVPNIKDAHLLGLRDLAQSLGDLTAKAKDGKSSPADLAGGTITITNIGMFGIDGGTPILNPGEAAILCMGAITRRPWEHEDAIALRSVMTLSLSFDHRLVDGKEGSLFLAAVAGMLADPTYLIALA